MKIESLSDLYSDPALQETAEAALQQGLARIYPREPIPWQPRQADPRSVAGLLEQPQPTKRGDDAPERNDPGSATTRQLYQDDFHYQIEPESNAIYEVAQFWVRPGRAGIVRLLWTWADLKPRSLPAEVFNVSEVSGSPSGIDPFSWIRNTRHITWYLRTYQTGGRSNEPLRTFPSPAQLPGLEYPGLEPWSDNRYAWGTPQSGMFLVVPEDTLLRLFVHIPEWPNTNLFYSVGGGSKATRSRPIQKIQFKTSGMGGTGKMGWPRYIERWRKLVSWECKDLPVDLVLSIINQESGGIPGIKSQLLRKKGCQELPTGDGGKELVCHDLGLMQVGPSTIQFFLDNTAAKVDLRDLTGTDERAARVQIRTGCWFLSWLFAKLNKYDPNTFQPYPGQASADQTKFATIAYNRGFGGLKAKLDPLRISGQTLTYAHLKAMFPTWKAFYYSDNIWANYRKNVEDIAQVTIRPPGTTPKRAPLFASLKSWIVPIGLLLAAYYFRVSSGATVGDSAELESDDAGVAGEQNNEPEEQAEPEAEPDPEEGRGEA